MVRPENATQSSSPRGEIEWPGALIRGPVRIELLGPEKVEKSRWMKKASVVFLAVTALGAIFTAWIWLSSLPRSTPWSDVPGVSLRVFTSVPGMIGRGETGQFEVTVVNTGNEPIEEVKVFLSCPQDLPLGMGVGKDNVIAFGTLSPQMQGTKGGVLSAGEVRGFQCTSFRLLITWLDKQTGETKTEEIQNGGTCWLAPIPLIPLRQTFWGQFGVTFLSAVGTALANLLVKHEQK